MNNISAEKLSDEGQWYVLETWDNRIALKHLTSRGFGIFCAGYYRIHKAFGTDRLTWVNILPPGYLLVYVWGLEKQWSRITDTPGVKRIVHVAGRAVHVQQDFVETLHKTENTEQAKELVALERRDYPRRRRRRSRRSRRVRARYHRPAFDNAQAMAV